MAKAKAASKKTPSKGANTQKKGLSLSKAKLLDMYERMLTIRRFEEKAGQLYGMGLIGGFCHLYIGQEAVVTGLQAAGKEGDSVITTYRDHGHMLACDMDPRGIMAELGFRSIDDMIGRVDALVTRDAVNHWKADGLDLTPILAPAQPPHDDVEVRAIQAFVVFVY